MNSITGDFQSITSANKNVYPKNLIRKFVTQSRLKDFEKSLESLRQDQTIDPFLKELYINAILSQIEEFKEFLNKNNNSK